MLFHKSISGSNISFEFPDGTQLLSGFNFTFGPKTYGLIGPNGIGKTTLLKLMRGEIQPTSGDILINGTVGILPQILRGADRDWDSQTILEVLKVKEGMDALKQIEEGNSSPEVLQIIGEDWDLADRIQRVFSSLGIGHLGLNQDIRQLSGGEWVKVHLAGLLLKSPSIVFLDEPTNNLDQEGREVLYDFIRGWKGCMLVVSHDRALLAHVEIILEMSNQGLQTYGGNYEFYLVEKAKGECALEQKIATARQDEKNQKKDLQQSLERQQRRMSRGKKKTAEGGVPKIVAGGLKRKAQTTLARVKDIQENRMFQARQELRELRDKVKDCNVIKIDLPDTLVPARKEILEIKDFNFRYSDSKSFLLAAPITFTLVGPMRVQMKGSNGAGKTTLLRLLVESMDENSDRIQGELRGTIQLKTRRVAYLDQDARILGEGQNSLLKRFSEGTPHLSESERRIRLGRFLFEQKATLKTISSLSGGEKMRAALACALFSDHPPELLILDEPTNNLDVDSIEQIESALSNFKGAILVISHDETFVEKIGATTQILLKPRKV